eukprot:8006308-Pyramimonas_sp.AAC.1
MRKAFSDYLTDNPPADDARHVEETHVVMTRVCLAIMKQRGSKRNFPGDLHVAASAFVEEAFK